MRLIDGDALMDDINNCVFQADMTTTLAVGMATRWIKNAPTIKPERKTGRWIPVTNGRGGHCCNRCNGYAPSYMNGDEHLSDFCPFCGADMIGDDNEAD